MSQKHLHSILHIPHHHFSFCIPIIIQSIFISTVTNITCHIACNTPSLRKEDDYPGGLLIASSANCLLLKYSQSCDIMIWILLTKLSKRSSNKSSSTKTSRHPVETWNHEMYQEALRLHLMYCLSFCIRSRSKNYIQRTCNIRIIYLNINRLCACRILFTNIIILTIR